jgi:transposase
MKREKMILKCGHTDMRRGIDGLSGVIIEELGLSPFDKEAMYLFCGRKKDRYKILYWDHDGFSLLYRRIEKGRLKWPNSSESYLELTAQQLRWLTEGIAIVQPHAFKEAQAGELL